VSSKPLRTGFAPGCTLNEATFTFVPPPPHELAPQLSELERFLHTDTHLPLLIKIGLAHVQFETIHPFLDGNGLVGRQLVTFLLCERQVRLKPVLYLSYFFKRHRQGYYDHLQAVRDSGTWEEWLHFFLRGAIEVSGQASEAARRILKLPEQHRLASTEKPGRAAANGYRILEHLYQHPIVSVTDVQALIGTTYPRPMAWSHGLSSVTS
jgi:Fic family protein